MKDHKQITGGLEHLVLEGADLSDTSWNDQAVVTAPVGRYQPNPWGLHDLIGNAAEWTRSRYESYPYRKTKERKDNARVWDRRVVRGGSFFDPFRRARHGIRWAYPVWQRVFNVGFRVMCEADAPPPRPEVAMQP
jgi:formylglycine-generating enzyme required for sulfatase activity